MARHTSRLATVLLALSLLITALPTQLPPALAPAPALAQTRAIPFSYPDNLPGERQSALSAALGDLDGDGALDIVLGNSNRTIGVPGGPSQVYLNDGTGRFADPSDLNPGAKMTPSVVLGDLNGDGALDIVLGNSGDPSQVYLNDGRGGFATPSDLNSGEVWTWGVAIGDLDGDGALDIVLGNSGAPSQVYLNDGAGGFTTPSNLNPGGAPTMSVGLGDLDGDGALDIVLGNYDVPSQVYLNDGAGGFATPSDLNSGEVRTMSVALGDLNGDDALDILLGNAGRTLGDAGAPSQVYLNDGTGRFATPSDLNPGGAPTMSVGLGDLDGDGALDILLGNFLTPSQIYLNGGAGRFAAPASLNLSGEATRDVQLGDLDGDGALDILLGNDYASSQIYRNDGTGRFGDLGVVNLGGGATWSVALGDLNSDGALDLLLGNYDVPSQVYLNDGRGGFVTPRDLNPGGASTWSVALGDLNSDGALDLLLGNYDVPSQVYLNDGRGGFVTPRDLNPGGASTTSVALGDLNGDGALDIILGNYDVPSQIYFNSGAGQFADPGDLNLGGAWTRSVALDDLNGDGALDIVLGNSGPPSQVYLNDGHGGFATSSELNLSGRATSSVALGDLDGDGARDIVLGNNGDPSQVYLNDGAGWFADPTDLNPGGASTGSVALGDLNGDGARDIVLGNFLTPSQVYLNDGAGWFADPTDLNPGGGATRSVALGDLNGDGTLDTVLGNEGIASQVFLNSGAGQFAVLSNLSPNGGRANSVALGDLNGDGALDIVLGNVAGPAQLYLNNGRGGVLTPSLLNPGGLWTESIALGDLNGDGALDIVFGNSGPPSEVYLNDGTGRFVTPRDLPVDGAWTMSVALGDLNGDGALDIVLGNSYSSSQVFLNDGTGRFATSRDLTLSGRASWSIALGDLSGDGALDIVLGNLGEPSQVYLNDGSGRFGNPTDLNPGGGMTESVALGDLNGDGALDIVLGNGGAPSEVYLNDGAGWFIEPGSINPSRVATVDVALGDLNGDRTLDIVLGNFDAPSEVYLNDGTGRFVGASPLSFSKGSTQSVALGDLDGDGTLDILLGSYGAPSQLYMQRNGFARQLVDTPPVIHVGQPGRTPGANLYAVAEILSTPTISIPYTLADAEGDMVRQIQAEYSLDGGGRWLPAIATTGTITQNLTTLAPPNAARTYTFGWDTLALPHTIFGQSDQVIVRLRAITSPSPQRNRVAGTYPAAASVWSSTHPFRVRGTLARVVDANGQAVNGALVYHLPAGLVQGARPLTNRLTGKALPSLASGYVASRDPLNPGDRLAALRVISDTEKYTLYYTSPITMTTGLPEEVVTSSGVQTLTVAAEHPLIAFKLSVALEWDARNDAAFLLQLRRDLRRAAELLYDWTDGQATLGPVTIYHDKKYWEDTYENGKLIHGADIQIYASNLMRPNSAQGGIVSQTVTETVTIAGAQHQVLYDPGMVRMPPTWNRNGDPGGIFGEDWPRTLAHELGHFTLFLDDNYLGLDAGGTLITLAGCPGAMSDPYRDDWSEFQPQGPLWANHGACAQTLSARTTGRSDWETIQTFYQTSNFTLRPPAGFNAHPGPDNLALALTVITEDGAGEASSASEAYVTLMDEAGKPYQPGVAARAMLYRGDGQRATDLGAPTGDLLLVRGGRPGDTLCVYEALAQRAGCTALSQATTRLTLSKHQGWLPDLQISQVTTQTIAFTVTTPPTITNPPALAALVFPDEGPPLTIRLSAPSNGVYSGAGTFTTPALGALIRLCVADDQGRCAPAGLSVGGAVYETITEYNLGGDPQAPRRRKSRRRSRRAPALSADGQAILFMPDTSPIAAGEFFAFQTVDRLPSEPAPPSWATPAGFGYRLIAPGALKTHFGAASLALSYFADDVPAGAESGIKVYFLPSGGRTWQALDTRVSPDTNTATARTAGEGLYVLMASLPLELNQGWNLIYAYPGATDAPARALDRSTGSYSLIYGYDDADDLDPWKLYAPGLSAPWDGLVDDLKEVTHGESYWIRSTQGMTLFVRPELRDGASAAGALTVPLGLDPWDTAASAQGGGSVLEAPPATYYGLAPITSTASLTVTAYVGPAEVPCGTTRTKAVTVGGVQGQGFSLNVLANGGGDAEGCGTPEATVRLVFLDGAHEVATITREWDNTRLQPIGIAQPLGPNPLWLPFIGMPAVPRPDLQVVGVTMGVAPPDAGEDYEVRVTIRNGG